MNRRHRSRTRRDRLLLRPAADGRGRRLGRLFRLADRDDPRIYGISTDTGGVSLKDSPWSQLNIFPAGAWTGLEGGWLLVLAAAVVLVRRRRFLFLAMYLGAIAILLIVSMCVYDITRSMAYLLPALFVVLDVLGEVESVPDLRLLCGDLRSSRSFGPIITPWEE